MVDAVVKNYTLGEIRALNRFIDTGLGTRALAELLSEGRGGCSRYGSGKALRKFPDAGQGQQFEGSLQIARHPPPAGLAVSATAAIASSFSPISGSISASGTQWASS